MWMTHIIFSPKNKSKCQVSWRDLVIMRVCVKMADAIAVDKT